MLVRDNKVIVAGGYRDPKRVFLRRSVTWTYEPVDCGVRLTFYALGGETYIYSVFSPVSAPKPVLQDRTLIAGPSSVRFSVRPSFITRQGGYASAVDPALTRIRVVFRPRAPGRVEITTCAR
jgi:hypothetical protein